MFVFFRNGTQVWFPGVSLCEREGGMFILKTSRARTVAEVQVDHIAFWCYDNEHLTTYGFAESVEAMRRGKGK